MDEFSRQNRICIAGFPNLAELFRHTAKQLKHNLLFILKMKVKVARADFQMSSDVVGSDTHDAIGVKQMDTGLQNAIAVVRVQIRGLARYFANAKTPEVSWS